MTDGFIGQIEMDNGPNISTEEVVLETIDPELSWTWSYILTALRIPHNIRNTEGVFYLLVPVKYRSIALREITDYLLEGNDWPNKPNDPAPFTGIQPPTLFLIGLLALFYTVTGSWESNAIWFQAGAGNSTAILEHDEWYRLITALTLHADVLHLVSNCILGGFLLHFFFLLTGTGVGLFTLLLASTVGNFINVLLHGPGHMFVGFSTAVFAVIGMLSVLSYKNTSGTTGSHPLIPLMASAALLAMLGSEGKRVDLGAHFFGLLCGLLTGKILCLSLLKKLEASFFFQIVLFWISIFIFSASWMLALQR
jgi:rhomboid protease GluP